MIESLRPGQRRRLAAEQAIYKRFNTFAACADACNAYARENGYDVHFNRLSIQQYVGCQTNLSMKRLKVLADLLRITNYKELNEVFVAPKVRGAGLWWIGEDGHRVQDLDLTMINLKQYKDKYCHN